MTPDTVHWIAQEIRHKRAEWTVEETWLQRQEKSLIQKQRFQRINFWRRVYEYAESQLAATAVDVGNIRDNV